MNSNAETILFPDECGVCGGNNSQCHVMEGTYNTTADQVAYKRVVRIPRGSSNIRIVQYSAGIDENFLGKTNIVNQIKISHSTKYLTLLHQKELLLNQY